MREAASCPHYYCRGRYEGFLCPARASAGQVWLDRHVEEQLILAFGNEGPLAVEEGLIGATARELDSARYALSQYVSNARLIETIGIEAFNAGAEAHQQRIDLAEMTLEEARNRQEAVSTV